MLTYYIGAGASANALPIVSNFFNDNFVKFIQEPDVTFFSNLRREERDMISKIDGTLRFMQNYWSVDTCAKSVYTNKNYFNFIKSLIQNYLLAEEHINGLDNRYGLLFQSLLFFTEESRTSRIPVNFISWNYDIQIERTLSANEGFHRNTNFSDFISINNFNQDVPFNLTKLNGSIYDFTKNGHERYSELINNLGRAGFDYGQAVKVMISDEINKRESPIKFAWEHNPFNDAAFKSAIAAIEKTTKLVIIGYSFPDFNTDSDKLILSQLPKSCDIYIQCNTASNLLENEMISHRLNELLVRGRTGMLTLIPSSNRFFMPYLEPKGFPIRF